MSWCAHDHCPGPAAGQAGSRLLCHLCSPPSTLVGAEESCEVESSQPACGVGMGQGSVQQLMGANLDTLINYSELFTIPSQEAIKII